MLALLLGALAVPAAAEVWWSATLTAVDTANSGGEGGAGSVGCATSCGTALSTPTFVRGSTTFSFARIEDVVTTRGANVTHTLEMDLSCAESPNPPARCETVNPPASLQFCVGTTAYALPDMNFREHRLHEGDVGWSVGDRIRLSIRTSSCASNTLPPPTVTLSAAPNPVTEGSSVTVTATLSEALSNNVTIPVTVSTSSPNTAEAGDVGTLTSITINSGQTAGTGTIATNQDPDGDDETFTVAFGTLPSTVAAGSVTSLEVRIVDDDPEVTLTAAPNPVAEGSSVTVTATLSESLSSAVTIPLTLTDNTAEPQDHGTLASIRIASGATSGTGTITTAHDPDDQDETFTVALGTLPATVVAGTPGSVQVRISDDESNLPAVTLSVTPNPVAEGSEARLTVTLSRTTLSGESVEIPLTYRYGTTERSDLRSGGGIVILRGETTGFITMFAFRDADTDDETFTVALDEAGLAAVELRPGYPASVEVTITDTGGDPGGDPQDPPPQDPPPQDPPPGGGGGGGAPPPGGGGGGTPVDPGNDEGDAPDGTGDTDGTGGSGDDDTTADDAPADVEPEPGRERVWYLPPAADPVRQGFVRVLNHSDAAGEATITATDDAGVAYDPLTLALEARQAAHFNTTDLEDGNTAKGLTGASGTGTGGWRLEIESEMLDIEALAYIRTTDGFVTGMNAVAPREDGTLAIPIFNPASNVDQVSLLRLVNPGTEETEATVTGTDDAGLSPGSPVLLTLPAGSSCTVDAAQLESGTGLACGTPQDGLGDGSGKWRLAVASDARLVAMSLLSSPTGHLTNLSGKATPDAQDMWHVDLLPVASDPLGRQGFVRVANRSAVAGAVTIVAHDDSDTPYETLRLSLDAGETAHFNSDDLEVGNAAKGLTGSTGSGMGTWRLALSGDGIEFEANAYIRTTDGFLTAMHAAAPAAGGVHRVAFFNPGSNADQVSVLRLVNRSSGAAEVSIDGTDDLGLRPGTTVRILVPATDAVELTAAELESGEADAIASGALGDGTGKWRLRIESDGVAAVLSLLSNPSGHLTNLSHADETRGLGELPGALLPAPATVTLARAGDSHVRGRWSAVAGARYDVDLLRDGVRQEDRSLTRAGSTSFRWLATRAGTYAIRARSVNADRVPGPWSALSDEVVID